jgi:hypothetical protein
VRKPIQITALRFSRPSATPEGSDSFETEIIALCDDGTIWTKFSTDHKWTPAPRIPQYQVREDWLADVAVNLTRDHHVRKDATPAILGENSALLLTAYNSGTTAKDAAKSLLDKIK